MGSALAAFPTLSTLSTFLAGGTGAGGLGHRRTLLVAPLLPGIRAVAAGHRATGEGEGAEEEGNSVARHVRFRADQRILGSHRLNGRRKITV
jgi:hypothetical protein